MEKGGEAGLLACGVPMAPPTGRASVIVLELLTVRLVLHLLSLGAWPSCLDSVGLCDYMHLLHQQAGEAQRLWCVAYSGHSVSELALALLGLHRLFASRENT